MTEFDENFVSLKLLKAAKLDVRLIVNTYSRWIPAVNYPSTYKLHGLKLPQHSVTD